MSRQSSVDPLSSDSLECVPGLEESVADDRCVARLSKFGLPTGLARPIQAWKVRVAEVCACLVQDMEDELIDLYAQEGRLRIPPGEGLRFVLCEELLEAVDTISENVASAMERTSAVVPDTSMNGAHRSSAREGPRSGMEVGCLSAKEVGAQRADAEEAGGGEWLQAPAASLPTQNSRDRMGATDTGRERASSTRSASVVSDAVASEPSEPTICPGVFHGHLHHQQGGWVDAGGWTPQNSPPHQHTSSGHFHHGARGASHGAARAPRAASPARTSSGTARLPPREAPGKSRTSWLAPRDEAQPRGASRDPRRLGEGRVSGSSVTRVPAGGDGGGDGAAMGTERLRVEVARRGAALDARGAPARGGRPPPLNLKERGRADAKAVPRGGRPVSAPPRAVGSSGAPGVRAWGSGGGRGKGASAGAARKPA
ncbi:hypothetical protein T484DRAFT_1889289, partial [Baffinella frigidus]